MFTKLFWRETLDRAIKSGAQALLLLWTADAGFNVLTVDAPAAAGLAGGAVVLSLLFSIVSSKLGSTPDSPQVL